MAATRAQMVEALRRKAGAGGLILGRALSAAHTEPADFLALQNSFRFTGGSALAGMMPFGDANGIVLECAPEALGRAGETPLIAGLCGTDPLRLMPKFLEEVKAAGFAGVHNYPTIGVIDGTFRAHLEQAGLGFAREVDLVRRAAGLGLFTVPFVFTPEEAAAMAEAGADAVIGHLGLTSAGPSGSRRARTPEEAAAEADRVAAAARAVRPEILFLVHGGPLVDRAAIAALLARSKWTQGYYGPVAPLDDLRPLRE